MKRKDLTLCEVCIKDDCKGCVNMIPLTRYEVVREWVIVGSQVLTFAAAMYMLSYVLFVLK